jgi:ubiquinone/menaquinone biosynthesis C-methylase UbiE
MTEGAHPFPDLIEHAPAHSNASGASHLHRLASSSYKRNVALRALRRWHQRKARSMAQSSRHDAWNAGDSYDAYMGRWSRLVAAGFLDWQGAGNGLDWLEIGCGTGALSQQILTRCNPRRLTAIEPSEGFVAQARANVADERAAFQVGDAQSLAIDTASCDVAVSGLVLNFVPDRQKALAEMKRVVRPGGLIGFYVWDYPGGGVEFMHAFWKAAMALDPRAADLSEDRRFADCTQSGLVALAKSAGFANVEISPIDVATVFQDFDDYWLPFTLGAGPAPGYCASLGAEDRERLKESLRGSLACDADGSIRLQARAWAVKSIVA